MASRSTSNKRKAAKPDSPEFSDAASDDEFGDGLLEGVLSQSEDDSENEDDDEDEDSEAEEDDFVELDSDEIPSEEEEELSGDNELKKINGSVPAEKEISSTETPKERDQSDDDDKPNYTITTDANGGIRYVYDEIEPGYDSDDSAAPETTNTIGNIPLSFYDSYPHIGYDINGKKIMRPAKGEALDALLDSIDIPKGWTGLTDPSTGKPLNLSQEELDVLRRIQMNEVPEEGYDPYPDMVEYFTGIEEIMPLSAAPEPKRRFLPSKHEAKRIMKIVRAIREGRIQPWRPPKTEEEEEEAEEQQVHYDIWENEQPRPDHIMNIPAPKLAPPGYDLSYNPPPEYLPSKAEKQAWESTDPEDREKEYLPKKFDSLRKVPAYDEFIKERFERSLDLYLAPRVRKNRLNIDPASLLPKLPKPEELRPFPTMCATIFRGHEGRVRSIAIDPSGTWLATGGDDGTARVWELLTGRQTWSVKLSDEEAVNVVQWRPTKDTTILAAAAGEDVYLMIPNVTNPVIEAASHVILDAGFGHAANNKSAPSLTTDGRRKEPPATWSRPTSTSLSSNGVHLQIRLRTTVKVLTWHRRGDFFATVSPTAQRAAVAIHTLSKHLSQLPFRRLPGLPQTAQFHPSRPLFFVATQRTVRIYDLAAQTLLKTLHPGARWISSLDVHPSGDHVLVGSYDRRLLWHDLDLSARPYKTMRFHDKAIRAVSYHKGGLPLFADASDDGSLQVFHGKVVSDLMENATVVPVKVLRGHKVRSALGVLDVQWHPTQPWLVSAGADGTCRLWM